MTENGHSAVLIIILMILAFGGTLYIRNLLTERAILKVVKIFHRKKALGVSEAKTLHELGLERPDFVQRMMKPRDYKQSALQILIKRGIIHVSADKRLYLLEERLGQKLRSKCNDPLSRGRS